MRCYSGRSFLAFNMQTGRRILASEAVIPRFLLCKDTYRACAGQQRHERRPVRRSAGQAAKDAVHPATTNPPGLWRLAGPAAGPAILCAAGLHTIGPCTVERYQLCSVCWLMFVHAPTTTCPPQLSPRKLRQATGPWTLPCCRLRSCFIL